MEENENIPVQRFDPNEWLDRYGDYLFRFALSRLRDTDEICKALEISSTNYWVILHRARLQLSSCMKQRWFQESN